MKKRILLLAGGQSGEHEVSLMSARSVLAALPPDQFDVTPVVISKEGRWLPPTQTQQALESGSAPSGGDLVLHRAASAEGYDAVFPILHGPMGEDGTVQGLLELANVPYVGSGVLGSALSMDKAMAKQVLAANGVRQARHRAFRQHQLTPGLPQQLADQLGLPLFVKPANMGSSVGVSKAKTVEDVRDAIALALTYDEWVVVEEAIVGREIEVAVLGNLHPKASLPGEIVPGAEFYDYADKYLDDGSQCLIPASLSADDTAEAQRLAVEVFLLLRCDGMARVDFFYEEGGRGFLCNEANTMPGFTPISMYPKMWQASGLSYTELID
ncbi:D-alanine--D-alanine ligase family protein, partial [Deinococcus sp.]|uniref:D-alanine--D-alanine ligase family protein n=1 Tax=Deinococcus sp. TaxID=47478 RepID=UPI002869B40B